MKILVTIANFGRKNDCYLQRLLNEYRSMPYEVQVVVLSNEPKDLGENVEVVIHTPLGDPWTFPFAHKTILAERVDNYDLFIYSEDDTLITSNHIEAFLDSTESLNEGEIAGFLRVERRPDGTRSVSTINGHFRWDPTSVVRRGSNTFAYFSNEHAASYLLTQEQLKRAILSGGFLVGPHESKYDLLVTAATDPYTQCGFRKLVNISKIEDFLIEHLPNKYIGTFGISETDLKLMTSALENIAEGTKDAAELMSPVTKLHHLRWSKNLYEEPCPDLLSLVPHDTRTLLSFGCGIGNTETVLKEKGIQVTAVPIDSVLSACVEARGIDTIVGDNSTVMQALSNRRFDCIIIADLLHCVESPIRLINQLSALLAMNGLLLASIPNVAGLKTTLQRVRRSPLVKNITDYDASGIHFVSPHLTNAWFASAGLQVRKMRPLFQNDKRWFHQICKRFLPWGIATSLLVMANNSDSL